MLRASAAGDDLGRDATATAHVPGEPDAPRREHDRDDLSERWQIDLLFKALKQHLKIKTSVGASENAVQVQIWMTLIAIYC